MKFDGEVALTQMSKVIVRPKRPGVNEKRRADELRRYEGRRCVA